MVGPWDEVRTFDESDVEQTLGRQEYCRLSCAGLGIHDWLGAAHSSCSYTRSIWLQFTSHVSDEKELVRLRGLYILEVHRGSFNAVQSLSECDVRGLTETIG